MIEKALNASKEYPLLSFFLGGLISIVLILLFLQTHQIVKVIGGLLMIVPEVIGIAETVEKEETFTLSSINSGQTVTLPDTGYYAIYSSDDLLLAKLELYLLGNSNFLLEIHQSDGSEVATTNLNRGLRLYDASVIPGRPLLVFWVAESGEYHFTSLTSLNGNKIYLVPHKNVGRESLIIFWIWLQIIIIATPPAYLYVRHIRERRQLAQAQAAANRKAWDKVFRS